MNVIQTLKFQIRQALFVGLKCLEYLIPKKHGLVLFTSWFGQKYLDNSKYVFEFFLQRSDYQPIWMTNDKQVKLLLEREGKPTALFNSAKGIWLQLRAEAVFSSIQFADYNTWLLSNCLYIDLGHGHPIKDPGAVAESGSYSARVYKLIVRWIDYYAIVAGTKTKQNYNVVPVPQNHIFISDYARNDVFVDECLRLGRNRQIEEFKDGRRAIVYMPTHRSNGRRTLDMTRILPLGDIQEYCQKQDMVFIIKKHFYHRNEHEDLRGYSNIIDVTDSVDVDPQVLLYQADLLISDYSACYVDYMLLKRPIVFYQYDLEEYQNTQRTLYYDFDSLNIAPVVHSKDDLLPTISELLSNGDPYLGRRMDFARDNYFDNLDQKDGREKVKAIFDKLYSSNKRK